MTAFTGLSIDPTTQSVALEAFEFGLRRPNSKGETFPRLTAALTAVTLTTANAVYTAIELTRGTVVTNIVVTTNTTAAGTPTHGFVGLYNSALAQVAVSADQLTGAWGASAEKSVALVTPYTVPADGVYYVAVAVVATTTPTLNGIAGPAYLFDLAPSVGFVDSTNTISTSLPATATNSAGASPIYAYVT